jgi:SAM-dependent methyltransferase
VGGAASAASIFDAVRSGSVVADRVFDRIFPDHYRLASRLHWTPIAVARRAASLFDATNETRILDVGAGVGKFCIVGALTTPATFVGVEHRGALVDAAREVVRRSAIPRIEIIHADMSAIDWAGFDGIYLFNPFYENLDPRCAIDYSIELSPTRFADDCFCVRRKLDSLPIGTRVITYHGSGSTLPRSYRLVLREALGSDKIALWRKERR